MNMPGLTAEIALYKTSKTYRKAAGGVDRVLPPLEAAISARAAPVVSTLKECVRGVVLYMKSVLQDVRRV
jgi:hypothetical protein